MFKIGDFSKLTHVPVSALRYYDELGLLKPAQIDRFTGYRYYSFDQLPRLNRILALKDLGLSLEQIAQVLDECLTPEQLRGMFRLKQAELQQHVREEQERLARVEARLRQIEMEDKMPDYDVILKPLPAQHVMTLRETIPTFDHVGTVWTETMQALQMAGATMIAPPFCLYYDEEFTAANMDIEFAFPIAPNSPSTVDLSGGRHMAARDLAASPQAACTVHKGDYSGLSNAYTAIGRWIEANGYRVVGPPREIYLVGGCAPADAVTEIQFPIEKVTPEMVETEIPGWKDVQSVRDHYAQITMRARHALDVAEKQAAALGHSRVNPTHILLGLTLSEKGMAAHVLAGLGVTSDSVRAILAAPGTPLETAEISSSARQIIDYAADESRQLGHDYIGTEHLLLGLLREDSALLGRFGLSPEQVRAEIMKMLEK